MAKIWGFCPGNEPLDGVLLDRVGESLLSLEGKEEPARIGSLVVCK